MLQMGQCRHKSWAAKICFDLASQKNQVNSWQKLANLSPHDHGHVGWGMLVQNILSYNEPSSLSFGGPM